MQRTGTITNIVPDGGYNSQNGYINTFQMTIQTQEGSFTGQIGSKSQAYPKNVGEQIVVEDTPTEYGSRFKKINPQYQGNQGQQPQQNQQQAPPQQNTYTPPPQATPQGRDFDKENHGKCFSMMMQAEVQRNGLESITQATFVRVAQVATACMNSYEYRQVPTTQPNPDYDPNATHTEEVPF